MQKSQAELNIECKDEAVKLTIGKKSRHFENKTNSDIEYMLSNDIIHVVDSA